MHSHQRAKSRINLDLAIETHFTRSTDFCTTLLNRTQSKIRCHLFFQFTDVYEELNQHAFCNNDAKFLADWQVQFAGQTYLSIFDHAPHSTGGPGLTQGESFCMSNNYIRYIYALEAILIKFVRMSQTEKCESVQHRVQARSLLYLKPEDRVTFSSRHQAGGFFRT